MSGTKGFIQPPIQQLTESRDSGMLNQTAEGRAFYATKDSGNATSGGASLSGPTPNFGHGVGGQGGAPKGIGGSEISAGEEPPGNDSGPQPSGQGAHSGHGAPASRALTPEELMAFADRMEQDLMERQLASEGSTAVDPALIRGGSYGPRGGGNGSPDQPPEWLTKYMDRPDPSQLGANMGEFQSGGPVDKVKAKQYLSQQEMLRHLKSQR